MAYPARLGCRQMVGRQCCSRSGLESRCRAMASLTRRACRQVVRRLGYRCHTAKTLAVVAARATADNTIMAEYRLLPAYGCFVAVITRGGSGKVSVWHARRGRAVVASEAGIRCQANVTKCRIGPNRGLVAKVAFCGGGNVSIRFCHCTHAVAGKVTSPTIPWCSLEHALDMAGVAPGLGMRAGKVEPRLKMVEFYGARVDWQQRCLRQGEMSKGH